MAEQELDDLELLRLYLDDVPDPETGEVFFKDYQLQSFINQTVDLYGAASVGWKIKAARVSEWYNVSLDGADLTRSQAFRQAQDMARTFANESKGEIRSIRLDSGFNTDTDPAEMA